MNWFNLMLWLVLLCSALEPSPVRSESRSDATQVSINGTALNRSMLEELEKRTGHVLPPGQYWYDIYTGAWGYLGQGTAGFTMPGLSLPGPLPADASGGSTGVFINGRELADSDVRALQAIGIPVQRGRWSMDAWGNAGVEGYPPSFNIWAIARSAAAANSNADSIYRTWGSGGNKGSTWIGSDGSLSHSTTINGKTYDYYVGD